MSRVKHESFRDVRRQQNTDDGESYSTLFCLYLRLFFRAAAVKGGLRTFRGIGKGKQTKALRGGKHFLYARRRVIKE